MFNDSHTYSWNNYVTKCIMISKFNLNYNFKSKMLPSFFFSIQIRHDVRYFIDVVLNS